MKKQLLLFGAFLTVTVATAQVPRMVLFEEFTGETCPPCAATNPGLNALLAQQVNQNRIAAIKWQVPIPSAPTKTWSLYQTDKSEINWRYGSSATGYGYPSQNNSSSSISSGINSAPQGRLDGQHMWAFGCASDHPANLNNSVLTNAAAVTSAFSINMSRSWNNDGSAIAVTVTVTAHANFTSVGSLVFRTVMVERLIQFSVQPGTNGETTFEDVAIKSFPTIQNGTSLPSSWTNGQTQTFTLNCTLPSYVRNKAEVAFVGFIQDDGNRVVEQAYRLDKQKVLYDAALTNINYEPISCSGVLQPSVTVSNEGSNAIGTLTITPYIDGVAMNPTTWNGNLAPSNSQAITLDQITGSTANGNHTLSVQITGMDNVDFVPSNNNSSKLPFLVASNYQGTPVAEAFETGTFPFAGWSIVNDGTASFWYRTTMSGSQGSSGSLIYAANSNTNVGEQEEVILPPISLIGAVSPSLTFDYAYAQKDANSNDQLRIMASIDCGANWETIFDKAGMLLSTVAQPSASNFVPGDSDWHTETISLDAFNNPQVLVKLVMNNGYGNNLYIDNINLSQSQPTGIRENAADALGMAVMPNPTAGQINIKLTSESASKGQIQVVNTLGQVVLKKDQSFNAGSNQISCDLSSLPSGAYHLVVTAGYKTQVKSLIVSH